MGASGLTDLALKNTSWNFDALNTAETPDRSSSTPVKHEATSPGSLTGSQKRALDDDNTQEPNSKKARSNHIGAVQDAANNASHSRFGGVVDLTGDDSDDEVDLVMPERQFVPRAEDDGKADHLQRRKAPTPPRTFTNGLPPVTAHPKQPPLMARSKPPIKPRSNRQSTVSSSHKPASPSVFSRPPRPSPSPTGGLNLSRQQTGAPPVGPLECVLLFK